ncbi:MAG: hypothetical protein QXI32_03250 [Candidatus Bathyarchaeia archaeon]
MLASRDRFLAILLVTLFVSGICIFLANRQQLQPEVVLMEFNPELRLEVEDVAIASYLDSIKVEVTYKAWTNNTDSLQVLLFVYKSFEKQNRSLYIFYDTQLMASEALRRANAIITRFAEYNIKVNPIPFQSLEYLAKQMPECILIMIDPLKEREGRRLEDALPAPLLDWDMDGYVRDDSAYGRSVLFDWMRKGLVLVTAGSLQPHKKILYADGVYTYTKDSSAPFDTHEFLTTASGPKTIIEGGFILGKYSPTRLSDSLGLAYRETPYGFDEDSMTRYGIEFYSYGNYELDGVHMRLPVFIRVGQGGWLAMDDSRYWLSDETLAHDLFMIYQQAIWDAEWVQSGWYYDSGTSYFSHIEASATLGGSVNTERIPYDLLNGKVAARVVGIAYSNRNKKGIVMEKILQNLFSGEE